MKTHLIAFWAWIKTVYRRLFGKPNSIRVRAPDGSSIGKRIELLKDAAAYWYQQDPRCEQHTDILLEIAQLEKLDAAAPYVHGQTIRRLK